MPEYLPVTTLDDLDRLDDVEILAGYLSGRRGDAEPSHNRVSRGFWHGWRNGAMDTGRLPPDAASMELARAFGERLRAEAALIPDWARLTDCYPPQ